LKFYDFHIQGRNYKSDKKLIHEAKRLGYAGVSLFYSKDDYSKSKEYLAEIEIEINLISNPDFNNNNNNNNNSISGLNSNPNLNPNSNGNFNVFPGIKIFPKNAEDLKKQIRNSRKKTNVLMAVGGDLKINRAACENIKLDILSRPYYKRRDCGINHVLAKEAARNDVAIELNVCDVLRARSPLRSKIMAHFQEIIKLQRKFKFPLIMGSGAVSIYDMRNPRDLIAFSQCFGLNKKEANLALSHNPRNIVDFNKKRNDIIVIGAKKVHSDATYDSYDIGN
jgi:ribonuclease P/MRP protein subunit RPP1